MNATDTDKCGAMRRRVYGMLDILLLCCLPHLVAAGSDGADVESGWAYQITPYLWVAGLSGDTAADDVGTPVDSDYAFFSLQNLDAAFAVEFTARKGQLALTCNEVKAIRQQIPSILAEITAMRKTIPPILNEIEDTRLLVPDVLTEAEQTRKIMPGTLKTIDNVSIAVAQTAKEVKALRPILPEVLQEIGAVRKESESQWTRSACRGNQMIESEVAGTAPDMVEVNLRLIFQPFLTNEKGLVTGSPTTGCSLLGQAYF